MRSWVDLDETVGSGGRELMRLAAQILGMVWNPASQK